MPRTMLNVSSPTLGNPRWAGDYFDRDHMIPGGATLVASQFNAIDAVTVVVGAAGAGIGATSVPVGALPGPIPNGTVLYFGGAKVAQLTAAAAKGDVALTTAALPAALVNADTSTFKGTGKIFIPSGTILGRTRAERDAGTGFGPAVDADEEIYLSCFDVENAAIVGDVELYRYNSVVYENFLPAFAAASATIKAFLRSRYVCSIGQV